MKMKIKKYLKENLGFIIAVIIIIALFTTELPYYIYAPGGTIDISDRISYDEMENYEGSLNMLYVTEYVATIPTYLLSYLFEDWDKESISESQISDEGTEEIEIRNKVMLENSINNAIYVAYTNAGCEIEVESKQNIVIATTTDNGLEIGDVIISLDGTEVENLSEIKEIINSKEVEDTILFKIERNSKEKEIAVKVTEEDGTKIIGAVILTNYSYNINPDIEIKFKASESGSSGGLMMALSIYSAISGEDILQGRNIAGTGTIDIEGNVGEIGGIKYKIMGAVKNNMDIVLVPSANYEEAMEVVNEKNYDIEVVSVDTFEDAINYLKK